MVLILGACPYGRRNRHGSPLVLRHTLRWDVLFLIAQMLNTADDELFDPFGNAEALMKPGGRLRFFGDVRLGC
jgi:hypothetical protein